MKKEYSTPDAVKIEFNYTESVVACHSIPRCTTKSVNTQTRTTVSTGQTNAAPGSGGWVCGNGWWIDETGKCKNN